MKTPEQVKKGLECCQTTMRCEDCPYDAVGALYCDCTNALMDDTFAYIRQLEVQAPKWISIKDKTPEPMKRVLLYTRFNETRIGVRSSLHPEWFFTRDASDENMKNITHWMPLPEPPKEETYNG